MLMTVKQACELLSVSRATIARWCRLGMMPAPVALGPRTLRFRRAEIEEWFGGGGLHQVQRGAVPTASSWLPDGHHLPDQATLAALSDEATDGEPPSLNDLAPDPSDENSDQG